MRAVVPAVARAFWAVPMAIWDAALPSFTAAIARFDASEPVSEEYVEACNFASAMAFLPAAILVLAVLTLVESASCFMASLSLKLALSPREDLSSSRDTVSASDFFLAVS